MVLNLDPVLFRLGPLTVYWYGFFMGISVAVGFYFLVKNGLRRGLPEDVLYNVALLAVLGGVIGARAVYVATNWGDYAVNPAEIVRVDHGGLSFHGALLGGVLLAWWYVWRKGITFGAVGDLAVPGLAVGYALVRVGNIFNQEILGRVTALGFERHPAQVYGSAIGIILLVVHNYLARRKPPPGYLFWSFVLWYQLLRGLIEETFRDNPLYAVGYVNDVLGVGFFTMTQLVTVPIILLAWWQLRKTAATKSEAHDA